MSREKKPLVVEEDLPLELEAAEWDEETLGLEWDETEFHQIADGLMSRRVTLH